MTLGIVDWGIGGLGFLTAFKARYPAVGVVYLSDAGDVPYGRQSAWELEARLAVMAARFADVGVTRLVVACNAMSTVLPAGPAGELGLERVCGVIDSAVQAALEQDAVVVGVVGGLRTVRSGAYARPLRAAGVVVRQRVAQPLSALIEAGRARSPEFVTATERVMRPLAHVDVLVLACTHYWTAVERFDELTTAAVIVDPAHETLERVVAGWFAGGEGVREAAVRDPRIVAADRFFTTGDPGAMVRAARLAYGLVLPQVKGVGLDLLGLS
jgi:glutamate racemase